MKRYLKREKIYFVRNTAGKGFFHPENVGGNTVAIHLPLELVDVLNDLQVSPTDEDLARLERVFNEDQFYLYRTFNAPTPEKAFLYFGEIQGSLIRSEFSDALISVLYNAYFPKYFGDVSCTNIPTEFLFRMSGVNFTAEERKVLEYAFEYYEYPERLANATSFAQANALAKVFMKDTQSLAPELRNAVHSVFFNLYFPKEFEQA